MSLISARPTRVPLFMILRLTFNWSMNSRIQIHRVKFLIQIINFYFAYFCMFNILIIHILPFLFFFVLSAYLNFSVNNIEYCCNFVFNSEKQTYIRKKRTEIISYKYRSQKEI